MKPVQLALDLPARRALGRDAYLVSEANRLAVALVDGWRGWPGGKLALCGGRGSGKTHLARVWADASGALVVPAAEAEALPLETPAAVLEDMPLIAGNAAAEEVVFHLHNAMMARGGRLLMTGRGAAPSDWDLRLPDLASRVAQAGVAWLPPPDDALLAGVLQKLFADRGLRPRPELVEWLTPRIDRSFRAAEAAVAQLDRAALAERRAVSIRMARDVLGP